MVRINNKEIGEKISSELRVQEGVQSIPQQTSDNIVLSYQVNDPLFYCSVRPIVQTSTLSNSAGPLTMHTCSTTRTTFLQGIAMHAAVGATHAGETLALLGTVAGGLSDATLLQLEWQTTTASSMSDSITFPYPIRLAKGSILQLLADDATDIEANCTIYLFEMADSAESRN